MKKVFFSVWLLILLLAGCTGNVAPVTLQETNAIPEDGILSEQLLEQIRKDSAIAVFQGSSGDISYEWTIFGGEVPADASSVDLRVYPTVTEEGVEIQFAQSEGFGFPALLSLHLNELWNAQNASAYRNDTAVASVSLTGTKHTILNLMVLGDPGSLVIRPEKEPEASTEVPLQPSGDEYLSAGSSGDGKVYGGEEPPVPIQNPGTAGEQEEYLSDVKQDSSQVYGELDASAKPLESTPAKPEDYLSAAENSTGRVYSDGSATGKDRYSTDPIPAGKPMPVEPEDQEVDTGKTYTCRFSIECSTILNNLAMLDPDKLEMVPFDGTILSSTTVTFYEGESVFDVLQRVCRENGIHLESSWTPIYNSAYVEGVNNLYEFDCGALSGWMYKVNGWYPNYGSSRYQLQQDDVVEWRYTCDLGNDIGGAYAVGG